MKCGAWRVQCEVWSVQEAVGSEKWEVWSVKCGVWSVKFQFGVRRAQCEVWSVKCEVWSVKEAVRSEKCEVWTVKCEVWSVKCGAWSLKFGVWSVECGVWRLCFVSRWKKTACRGKDTVGTGFSSNYRSFILGKLPPPACPGLCYMISLWCITMTVILQVCNIIMTVSVCIIMYHCLYVPGASACISSDAGGTKNRKMEIDLPKTKSHQSYPGLRIFHISFKIGHGGFVFSGSGIYASASMSILLNSSLSLAEFWRRLVWSMSPMSTPCRLRVLLRLWI